MSKFRNAGRDKFLSALDGKASIDLPEDTLAARCKFNFSYFDVQDASQSFEDWTLEQLISLLNKLKEYSKSPLKYWILQKKLNTYKSFPKKSKLSPPRHVPHQAVWARFRLEQAVRLVGFVLPDDYDGKLHEGTKRHFDSNVFYVVFLDRDHQFYPMDIKDNGND